MSVILMILGAFLLFSLLAMVATMWFFVVMTGLVFIVGGLLIAAIFHAGQTGFLAGGIGAVLVLWVLLAIYGKEDKVEHR